MPLGEHQVHHPQHAADPARQVLVGRDAERDASGAYLPLGPHQPLRQGGLADKERPGDFGRAQPAQGAQRQRHAGAGVQRRVAAGEDEPELVVGDPARRGSGVALAQQQRRGLLLAGPPGLAAEPVHGVVLGHGDQPSGRIRRQRPAGPAAHRRRERLLDGVLGQAEIAGQPGDHGHGPAPLAPEDDLGLRRHPWPGSTIRGRTSIARNGRPGWSRPAAAPRLGRRTPARSSRPSPSSAASPRVARCSAPACRWPATRPATSPPNSGPTGSWSRRIARNTSPRTA